MPLVRRLGNRLVSTLGSWLFRLHTTDLYTGMKGFRRRALPFEMLTRDGFEHGAMGRPYIVDVFDGIP
jgi:hypothetical protein